MWHRSESGEDANEAARDILEQVKAQQPQTGLADMRLPHAGLEISNSQQAAWDMLEHTEAQVGIADLPPHGAQIPSCGTESGEDANEAARDMLEQVKAQQPQTELADMRLPHAGLEISNSQQAAWDMLEHTEAQVGIADLPPHGNCNQALPLGDHDAAASCQIIIAAYEEAVHFAPNLHQVPQGGVGSKFVNLLAGLYQRFGVGATGDGLALKAAMVMTQLLLQQPVGCQNVREHRQHLERRLGLWEQGDVNNLMIEARTVQAQLKQRNHSSKSRHKAQDDARRFAKLVHEGKVGSSLRMLSDDTAKGVHMLDTEINGKSVREILSDKHPPAEPIQNSAVMPGEPPAPPHPTYFAAINRESIRQAAIDTQGAAGPSGMDAAAWRYLCTGFGSASDALCDALAGCARRLACEWVDPAAVDALVACRLIALEKDPVGVRPIGIGEVARRIMSRAILRVTKADIMGAVGCLQLCAGQESGIEAAIHALNAVFEQEETEGVLFADASNAFNRLNRSVCLLNVRHLCPPMADVLINTYRAPARLFVNGESITSSEGTTQGDPLAMAMYALGTLPLIREAAEANTIQAWYADDSTAASNLQRLRQWWAILVARGPAYGYYPNASKSVLLVKPRVLELAQELFADTAVQIRTDGYRHLGAVLGTEGYCQQYVQGKVASWCSEVRRLATYATSQPQAAYSALCQGLKHKWSFVARTIRHAASLMQPLEDAIHQDLIPALTGRPAPGQKLREVLALPCRQGGLGIIAPTTLGTDYSTSRAITEPLVANVLKQEPSMEGISQQLHRLKTAAKKDTRQKDTDHAKSLMSQLDPELLRTVQLAAEKGASSWLTCRPLRRHGFTLHKGAFRDALCMRYGWDPCRLPTTCACGKLFTPSHAMSCPIGGYPSLRHNEVRDLTAGFLNEVAHDVQVEPHLQPVTGERFTLRSTITDEQARLDVVASGLYGGRFERTFFDVRVFNPFASSNRKPTIAGSYKKHEDEKRRCYESRIINVEHASFVPVVFSTTGGQGKAAAALYARIAAMLADKRSEHFSVMMALIRTKLAFALVRAAVACLRGHRHKATRARAEELDYPASLAVAECNLS